MGTRLKRLRRRMLAALVGSLLLHVLFLLFIPVLRSVLAPFEAPLTAKAHETITIERLAIERRPKRRRPQVAARPAPRLRALRTAIVPAPALPQPRVAVVPVARQPRRPELSKFAPHAPAAAPVARLAYQNAAPRSKPVAPRGRRQLSAQVLANVENDLGAAIARDRSGLDPLSVRSQGEAPETKRIGPDYANIEFGGHGVCHPIKDWTDGGWDYYYVACNVHIDDGSVQLQGVPWPIRFPPNRDPFNGTLQHDAPVAMPLPGWHLAPGEILSEQLRQYAHEHGVDL